MSFGIAPDDVVRTGVRALVDSVGVGQAAVVLGIGREATARIAAGLGVRRGTLLLAERSLKKQNGKHRSARSSHAAKKKVSPRAGGAGGST